MSLFEYSTLLAQSQEKTIGNPERKTKKLIDLCFSSYLLYTEKKKEFSPCAFPLTN